MLIGAHSIIYSTSPEADRAFLRDVLNLTSIDAGGGYVIFGLPPSESAVHQHDVNNVHELYLMCADVEAFIEELKSKSVACGAVEDKGWGLLTRVPLPSGGKVSVYQPRHARPAAMSPKTPKRVARRAAKAPMKKRRKTTKKV